MIKMGPHYRDPIEALEHHGEKYDFYEGHDGSKAIGHFAPWALSHYYDLEVQFLGDAEAQLPQHKAAGGAVMLAPGHTSLHDPTAVGGAIGESDAFKLLRGNIDVMAKEGVARMADGMAFGLVNKGMRLVLDNFVSLDTYRTKDILNFVAGIEDPEQREAEKTRLFQLMGQTHGRLIGEFIRRMDAGRDAGIFAEGERRADYLHVEPPKEGIFNVATGTTRTDEILVFPIAVDFARGGGKSHRHADVIVGEGLAVEGGKIQFLGNLRDAMQACVDASPTGLAAA